MSRVYIDFDKLRDLAKSVPDESFALHVANLERAISGDDSIEGGSVVNTPEAYQTAKPTFTKLKGITFKVPAWALSGGKHVFDAMAAVDSNGRTERLGAEETDGEHAGTRYVSSFRLMPNKIYDIVLNNEELANTDFGRHILYLKHQYQNNEDFGRAINKLTDNQGFDDLLMFHEMENILSKIKDKDLPVEKQMEALAFGHHYGPEALEEALPSGDFQSRDTDGYLDKFFEHLNNNTEESSRAVHMRSTFYNQNPNDVVDMRVEEELDTEPESMELQKAKRSLLGTAGLLGAGVLGGMAMKDPSTLDPFKEAAGSAVSRLASEGAKKQSYMGKLGTAAKEMAHAWTFPSGYERTEPFKAPVSGRKTHQVTPKAKPTFAATAPKEPVKKPTVAPKAPAMPTARPTEQQQTEPPAIPLEIKQRSSNQIDSPRNYGQEGHFAHNKMTQPGPESFLIKDPNQPKRGTRKGDVPLPRRWEKFDFMQTASPEYRDAYSDKVSEWKTDPNFSLFDAFAAIESGGHRNRTHAYIDNPKSAHYGTRAVSSYGIMPVRATDLAERYPEIKNTPLGQQLIDIKNKYYVNNREKFGEEVNKLTNDRYVDDFLMEFHMKDIDKSVRSLGYRPGTELYQHAMEFAHLYGSGALEKAVTETRSLRAIYNPKYEYQQQIPRFKEILRDSKHPDRISAMTEKPKPYQGYQPGVSSKPSSVFDFLGNFFSKKGVSDAQPTVAPTPVPVPAPGPTPPVATPNNSRKLPRAE